MRALFDDLGAGNVIVIDGNGVAHGEEEARQLYWTDGVAKKARATVPGVAKNDISKLRSCSRSAPLLTAAIARADSSSMQALDHKQWDSVRYVRRWSRNGDGITALVASDQELDVYWTAPWSGRTNWRIVQRDRVDGFIQTTIFDSVGISELRAMALSDKEAEILRSLQSPVGEQSSSRLQSGRL
ncbi:hypothetical protein DBR47_12280 [Paucibacter sp. KBW04]|nr:hypothetical protein DBR47_12280 [Paucibacter sp. KBW04]